MKNYTKLEILQKLQNLKKGELTVISEFTNINNATLSLIKNGKRKLNKIEHLDNLNLYFNRK